MNKNIMFIVTMLFVLLIVPIVSAEVGIDLTLSKYEPFPASPGQVVKVWLLVQNTGDTDAKDVVIQLAPQAPFSLYNQASDTKTIPILGAQKDYLIDFNVKVDDNAAQGYNNLKVKYSYGANPSMQDRNLQIYIQAKDATLGIESVKVDPAEISPGSDGKITITVKNNAPASMTDLTLKLQLQAIVGSTVVDLPFAPMDSSVEHKEYLLEPGKSADFTYTLRVYPDAVSKVYKIPFSLTYYDSIGTQRNKTDFIGVVVNSVPDLSVLIDKTDLSEQVKTGSVTLKIVNKGLSDIKFLNIIMRSSQDYELLSNSDTTYVGNLVSDDYQTAEYKINVKTTKNQLAIPITIQYRDANNKYYEKNVNVALNLIDSNKLNPTKGVAGYSWITIIVVLLIIGGIWYYFKNKNKKNKKGQIY